MTQVKTGAEIPAGKRSRIAGSPAGMVTELGVAVSQRLSQPESLSHAAQEFVSVIYEALPSVFALARTYVMVRASALSVSHREFLARQGEGFTPLASETPVLVLIGTRGDRPGWNDVGGSRNHLCIPLTSASAVEEVPMVAALLTELGLDLTWLRVPRNVFARKLLGGFNGLFYVAEARRAADRHGRLIIPAQDFVASEKVVTVFGIGGAYLDGTIMASIFFTREALTRTEAEAFAPLAGVFKKLTSNLVKAGRLFQG